MALSPQEIFETALSGGFSPEEAATMTAIALAESSGDPTALLSTEREHSVGLWQINMHAHEALVNDRGWDLTNPLHNAQAAYEVSIAGQTMNPWSVTHHGSSGEEPKYLQFLDEALAAAAAAGHDDIVINDLGTGGFRADRVPVARSQVDPAVAATLQRLDEDDHPEDPADSVPPPGSDSEAVVTDDALAERVGDFDDMSDEALDFVAQQGDGVPVGAFLRNALGQDGDRYVYGADPDPNDPNPDVFDCAELVQWSLERLGAPDPGGSTNVQQHWLRDEANGAVQIPVELAKEIPGAVIYSVSSRRAAAGDGSYAGHVAISLGNGETIEARGKDWGVGSWDIGDRFQHAFLMPGVDYTDLDGIDGTALAEFSDQLRFAEDNAGTADSDRDLLADHFEIHYGTDPALDDTDGDGLTDGYEILVLGTDALSMDSDRDWMRDDIEVLLGFDPTVADNPDGAELGMNVAPDEWFDGDGDGIVDWMERNLGFDPTKADSDDDGIIDGMESLSGGGVNELPSIEPFADSATGGSGDSLDSGLIDG